MSKRSFKPSEDGITHLNIYSQAKTQLGRYLSNFAYAPIKTDDGKFNSVEGYWYWLNCSHPQRDELREAFGANAKALGRHLGAQDWNQSEDFKAKIKQALTLKLNSNPLMLSELKRSRLPLVHYYVYGSKIVLVSDGQWLIDHLESLRADR